MTKISVTMATFNEEANISRSLESVKKLANEIIVVDGESTDQTRILAEKNGAKVHVATNVQNFHINKQKANDLATGEWILQLDADEVCSAKLSEEILRVVVNNPEENGFWIPRRNFFLGRFLKKGGTYPDYTLRLYRKKFGHLPAESVHEQAQVKGKTGYLKNDLMHYSNKTFSEYLERRMNRYTDLMAKDVSGGPIDYFFLKPLFDPIQGFIPVYFRHLGFLDGFAGFIWALFQALNFPIAYIKSVEKKYASSSH